MPVGDFRSRSCVLGHSLRPCPCAVPIRTFQPVHCSAKTLPRLRRSQGTLGAMTWINDYAPLVLRICLVVLFPFSGLDKILNWQSAMTQAGNIPFKPVMLIASIIVE